MGMTPNEAELIDVENHYPTDRVPKSMKEKSVAENLLEKMAESQWVLLCTCQQLFSCIQYPQSGIEYIFSKDMQPDMFKMLMSTKNLVTDLHITIILC